MNPDYLNGKFPYCRKENKEGFQLFNRKRIFFSQKAEVRLLKRSDQGTRAHSFKASSRLRFKSDCWIPIAEAFLWLCISDGAKSKIHVVEQSLSYLALPATTPRLPPLPSVYLPCYICTYCVIPSFPNLPFTNPYQTV